MRPLFKWARTFHIYLSLLGFVMFLFFAVTGITLNHDSFGFDKPSSTTSQVSLPAVPTDKDAVIASVRKLAHIGLPVSQYSDQGDEIDIAFAGPGKRAQVVIHRPGGVADVTLESRGLAGLLADLHKGAESGVMWKAILDVISALLGLSSLTGIIMLFALPKRQKLGMIALAGGTIAIAVVFALWVPR